MKGFRIEFRPDPVQEEFKEMIKETERKITESVMLPASFFQPEPRSTYDYLLACWRVYRDAHNRRQDGSVPPIAKAIRVVMDQSRATLDMKGIEVISIEGKMTLIKVTTSKTPQK